MLACIATNTLKGVKKKKLTPSLLDWRFEFVYRGRIWSCCSSKFVHSLLYTGSVTNWPLKWAIMKVSSVCCHLQEAFRKITSLMTHSGFIFQLTVCFFLKRKLIITNRLNVLWRLQNKAVIFSLKFAYTFSLQLDCSVWEIYFKA